MKKLFLATLLGAVIVGGFAHMAILNYVSLIERQNADIVALKNEIAHLEFANRQLLNENSQLYDQIK